MPLPPSVDREEVHQRRIELRGYRRRDGVFEIEAHLVDTKPFPFQRPLQEEETPPDTPLHDLWVRLVVDEGLVVRDVVVAADTMPFAVCLEATDTLKTMIGERIGHGWSRAVRERLGGSASCTHLAELLGPLATLAFQSLVLVRRARPEALDASGKPQRIDSCYAYGSGRDVVRRLWPQHYTGRTTPESS